MKNAIMMIHPAMRNFLFISVSRGNAAMIARSVRESIPRIIMIRLLKQSQYMVFLENSRQSRGDNPIFLLDKSGLREFNNMFVVTNATIKMKGAKSKYDFLLLNILL